MEEKLLVGEYSALIKAVVKLPEEPRPVPAGMSASVVISIWGFGHPLEVSFSASLMMGCCTSSIFSTVSSFEYLR